MALRCGWSFTCLSQNVASLYRIEKNKRNAVGNVAPLRGPPRNRYKTTATRTNDSPPLFFPFFFSKPHLYYIVYLLTCVTVCRFMCENGGPRKEKKELININLQQQHDAISHSTPSNSQESRFSLYRLLPLFSFNSGFFLFSSDWNVTESR
jgi:hypothetical protein